MNKYLEKVATWKDPSKFLGYVTGARKGTANAKVRHMEEAIANKLNLDDLKRNAKHETEETSKARAVAAGGTLAIGAGAAYGYKKVRDKQKQETLNRYREFLKDASVGAAVKELGSSMTSGVGNLLRRVGKTTIDVMNTAGGGKIKDYAVVHGMKHGGKEYKQFINSSPRDQMKHLLKKSPSVNKEQITQDVTNLHGSRRTARIALGSTAIAGVSGYGWHKNRQALKKTEQGYY